MSSRLFLCLLLLFSGLFSGCGAADAGRLSGAQDPAPAPPGVSGNFKQAVVLSFLAPTDGPEGFVDITPGAVSDGERNAILNQAASPAVQARLDKLQGRHIPGDTHSHLYQFTVRTQQNDGFINFVYSLDRLLGTAEPYIAYRPETFLSRSIHNGITPRLPSLNEGSNHITVTWTVPSDGTPLFVAVQPVDLRQGDVGTTVPAGTNEIVMEIDATLQNGSITGTVTVNGQAALDLSTVGTDLSFYPILKHQASGLYHCTAVKDGEVYVDESYMQRGLKWEPAWPIIERSTFEPIAFNHRLVWDTGDPDVDASHPRWRASFPGATIPARSTGPNLTRTAPQRPLPTTRSN